MLSTHAANARVPRKDQIPAFKNINEIPATWLNQRPSVLTECEVQIDTCIIINRRAGSWLSRSPCQRKKGRYVTKASLRHISHECSPLRWAISCKHEIAPLHEIMHSNDKNMDNQRKVEVLHLFRWFTHTHTCMCVSRVCLCVCVNVFYLMF